MSKTALTALVGLLIIVVAFLIYKVIAIALPFILGGIAWTVIVFIIGYVMGHTNKKPIA